MLHIEQELRHWSKKVSLQSYAVLSGCIILFDHSFLISQQPVSTNLACPEKLDKVDDLLVEYEGREELLIDNLTRMLTERGQAQPILHYMSLNTLNEEGTLSSSEQSLMSNSNSDGKLVDNVAYRAGVEALVKEGESAVNNSEH